MAESTKSREARKVKVVARGRLVTVRRRGDRVTVSPRLHRRLRDRSLRTARFRVRDVTKLTTSEPGFWRAGDGWISFDFDGSSYRVVYSRAYRAAFRDLIRSGWRRVEKAHEGLA